MGVGGRAGDRTSWTGKEMKIPTRSLLPPASRRSRPATARPLCSDTADVRVNLHAGSTEGARVAGADPDPLERRTGISSDSRRAPVGSVEEKEQDAGGAAEKEETVTRRWEGRKSGTREG